MPLYYWPSTIVASLDRGIRVMLLFLHKSREDAP